MAAKAASKKASGEQPVRKYFSAVHAALDGLDTYLKEEDSPLYQHDLVGAVVASYLTRLRGSFASWENRLAFAEKFRVSQSESGFPAFQNVLELENDRREAKKRLAEIQDEETLRQEMVVSSAGTSGWFQMRLLIVECGKVGEKCGKESGDQWWQVAQLVLGFTSNCSLSFRPRSLVVSTPSSLPWVATYFSAS